MGTDVILILITLAVLSAAQGVYYVVRFAGEQERSKLRQRLQTIDDQTGSMSLLRARRVSHSATLDRFLRQFPGVESLEQMLLQTDLNWTVAAVLGAGLLGGTVVAAVLLAFTTAPAAIAVLMLPVGLVIPVALVANARTRRSQKLSTQLPDALDMLIRSLQAGHGIASGFKLVATEMPVPVAVEFGRCFEEQNVGVDFKDAITHMTERVPDNLDLKIFAVSIVIQHETGGNLVEILSQISHTIRERFKFYGKLQALTAEGRASGIILGALPIVTAMLVVALNSKYMEPMLSDSLGRGLTMGGIAIWAVGLFWLKQLSNVDF